MKTLRLSVTVLTLALASLPVAAADTATPTPPPAPGSETDRPAHRGFGRRGPRERARFAERLGLTDEQRSQLQSRRADVAAAARAIRDDASLTPDQKREKLRATRQAARGEMRAILTPEQQAKFDTMKPRAPRRAHRRDPR